MTNLKQFKPFKMPMCEGIKKVRTERAGILGEHANKNSRRIEKCVWQDEKDFTLEVTLII